MAYTREQFVKKYGAFIYKVTKGTGILPGTLVAQAILESSGQVDGKWLVGVSGLSRNANNYFGIKCHGWSGRTYNAQTGEQTTSGQSYNIQACFRAYNSVEDSIRDYVRFLKENDRYRTAGVFEAKDVKTQAERLKSAGYATAVNYAATVNEVYLSIVKYLQDIEKQLNRRKMALLITSALILASAIAGVALTRKKD